MEDITGGEDEGRHNEVSLETRVDGEAAGSGFMNTVDVLQGEVVVVVPVAVVQVLSDQCVGLHCAQYVSTTGMLMSCIYEVEQLVGAWWTIVSSSLLLHKLVV